MSSRQKKPPVKPEKRLEWLARYENGESPPKIATTDGFDARTVRKHIEIASQEKETKEARAIVLRNALERHYADLCSYAERLLGQSSSLRITEIGMSVTPALPYEQQLADALRQHIPRSPIWGLLNQRTKLSANKAEITKELDSKIKQDITSDSSLLVELTPEENSVIPGLIDALTSQAQFWVLGQATLNAVDNLRAKPAENDFVELSYGAFGMGKARRGHIELVRAAIINWEARIKEWDAFHNLEKNSNDLRRVDNALRDEVAVIALRRVVPGRCRYCPA
jgi:hypothetical protein